MSIKDVINEEFSNLSIEEQWCKERLAEIKMAFQFLDQNKDNAITKDDSEVILKNLDKSPTSVTPEKIIKKFDQNDDGKIDFDEFASTISKYMNTPLNEDHMKKSFSEFDIERTGFISGDHLKRALSSCGSTDLSDDELNTLMYVADPDRDGKLSYETFRGLVVSKQRDVLVCFVAALVEVEAVL